MQYELVKPEIFLERVKKNSCIDYECIKKAVDFTIVAHHNQKRDSGEDYVIHPLNVALILLEMKFGTSTIIAGYYMM